MSSPKISTTITYKKPGIAPPLYLAGSFSDPEWQPTEMEHTTDEDGEHTFRSEVLVEVGKDYQFKMRVGPGDWWVLSQDYATATDDSGNKNNVLHVPSSQSDDNEKPAANDPSTPIQDHIRPPMPSVEVPIPQAEENRDDADDLKTPLFAHECLGAYSFGDDESEEEVYPTIPMRRYMESKSTAYETTDIDVNDPTLEKFPSDRNSIMDALRTIQTHLSDDQSHLKDGPGSPRAVSSGRPSIDSADEMNLSPAPLTPSSSRRREQRLSHSSFRRSRSAVSLGSIAEEDSKAEEAEEGLEEELSPGQLSPSTKISNAPPVVTRPSPNTATADEERRSPPSEEDEAVVMRNPTAAANGKDGKMAPAKSASDEFIPNQWGQDSDTTTEHASETVTKIDLQPGIHQANAPLESPKLNETELNDSEPSQSFDMKNSDQVLGSKAIPRPDEGKDAATSSESIQTLLTRARRNKKSVTMAAGALAVAVGIRWWTGSAK